ncbi:MAG TPA: low molecular weight phosphatase family protein [Xanthobacteraceae bacterium]
MDEAQPGVRPQSVLFLCAHNVVRSPMAAALARHFFGSSLRIAEAGVRTGEPDPFVAAAMEEVGIDLKRHKPVMLDELEDLEGLDFDLVVSLSPEAHHRALELTRAHPVQVEYWPIPNPSAVWGNREQRLDAYRTVRDDLLQRIRSRFGAATAASG